MKRQVTIIFPMVDSMESLWALDLVKILTRRSPLQTEMFFKQWEVKAIYQRANPRKERNLEMTMTLIKTIDLQCLI